MDQKPLITKYRPDEFDQIIGNQLCVKSLQDAIKSVSCPHAFLFTGSSGIGKTTLARIIAKHVNASINEIDAASNSSVEDTRRLAIMAGYIPIMSTPNQLCIIDEAHNLSSKGWEPLLKLIEEPPKHFYIALCTTEPQKVPATIKSRCFPVALKPLRPQEISELVEVVADLEGWKLNNDVFSAIVQASEGSARKALTILQAGHALQSREELAKIIIQVEDDSSPIIELCNYLIKGGRDWKRITESMKKIDDEDEAIIVAGRYLAGCMLRSEENQAHQIWIMLQGFIMSNTWDKKVQLAAALGSIVWGKLPF